MTTPTESWHKELITDDIEIAFNLKGKADIFKTEKATAAVVDTISFGKTLFLNGELQSTLRDEYIYHEMLVCPVMELLSGYKNVDFNIKILGGGEGATAREVLRWSGVKEVLQVDWDGELVEKFKTEWPEWNQGAYNDPRVTIQIGDAWDKGCETTKWDGIIIDLPDPDGPIERWKELILNAKSQLSKDDPTIIVMNAGPILPWDNEGMAVQLMKLMKENFDNTDWDIKAWHTFIPSFATAGEWCFIGVGGPGWWEAPSKPNKRAKENREKVIGLRYWDELTWLKSLYWSKDFPEILRD